MKLFSPKGKPLTRATAKNAALLNQLATPGLGSLLGRRWFEGIAQLILSSAGFVLIVVWFVRVMTEYYGQITGNVPARPVGWILEAGAILFVGAWAWSAWTSFSLMREASANKQHSLENFGAPPVQKLMEAKIFPALALVPDWQLAGTTIVRTYEFKDFPAAIKFVETIAAIAEQEWHHPDIDIRWNKVTLMLSTHDAGGLTEKDFKLAKQFDKV